MPPNHDSLIKHIPRANFQASIHKRSLLQHQNLPSPEGNGWKMDDGELAIDWMDLAPAPDSIIELAFCKCKGTKCTPPDADDTCCASRGLRCTDLCQCRNCNNSAPLDEEEALEEANVEEDNGEDEESRGDEL